MADRLLDAGMGTNSGVGRRKQLGLAHQAKLRSMRKLTSLRHLMPDVGGSRTGGGTEAHRVLSDEDIAELTREKHNIRFSSNAGGRARSLDDSAVFDLERNPSFRELMKEEGLHFDKDQGLQFDPTRSLKDLAEGDRQDGSDDNHIDIDIDNDIDIENENEEEKLSDDEEQQQRLESEAMDLLQQKISKRSKARRVVSRDSHGDHHGPLQRHTRSRSSNGDPHHATSTTKMPPRVRSADETGVPTARHSNASSTKASSPPTRMKKSTKARATDGGGPFGGTFAIMPDNIKGHATATTMDNSSNNNNIHTTMDQDSSHRTMDNSSKIRQSSRRNGSTSMDSSRRRRSSSRRRRPSAGGTSEALEGSSRRQSHAHGPGEHERAANRRAKSSEGPMSSSSRGSQSSRRQSSNKNIPTNSHHHHHHHLQQHHHHHHHHDQDSDIDPDDHDVHHDEFDTGFDNVDSFYAKQIDFIDEDHPPDDARRKPSRAARQTRQRVLQTCGTSMRHVPPQTHGSSDEPGIMARRASVADMSNRRPSASNGLHTAIRITQAAPSATEGTSRRSKMESMRRRESQRVLSLATKDNMESIEATPQQQQHRNIRHRDRRGHSDRHHPHHHQHHRMPEQPEPAAAIPPPPPPVPKSDEPDAGGQLLRGWS